jgi:hypothetical protein
MRRVLVTFGLAAGMVLGPASAAGATHTADCEHARTTRAHHAVPHRNHQAHMSIPYCPPEDAPRHRL